MRRKPNRPLVSAKKTGVLRNENQCHIMNIDEARLFERLDRLIAGMDKLDKIAAGMDKMVSAIPKPAGLFWRVGEVLALIAGILSLLGIFEIVRNWIVGG
jgi:hypothetical protein